MDELFNVMEDLDIREARINVSGAVAVIDNVKKVIIMSDTNITIDHGKGQLSLYGTGLNVEYIYDGRIRVSGRFEGIEFFGRVPAAGAGRRVAAPKTNESRGRGADKNAHSQKETAGRNGAV